MRANCGTTGYTAHNLRATSLKIRLLGAERLRLHLRNKLLNYG